LPFARWLSFNLLIHVTKTNQQKVIDSSCLQLYKSLQPRTRSTGTASLRNEAGSNEFRRQANSQTL
jgi:hypothetical protein